MNPISSPKIYPRVDQKFKTHGSLNFDLLRTKVFKERPKISHEYIFEFLAHFLVAVAVGGFGLGIYYL
jgi:hypothetical protein